MTSVILKILRKGSLLLKNSLSAARAQGTNVSLMYWQSVQGLDITRYYNRIDYLSRYSSWQSFINELTICVWIWDVVVSSKHWLFPQALRLNIFSGSLFHWVSLVLPESSGSIEPAKNWGCFIFSFYLSIFHLIITNHRTAGKGEWQF